VLIPGTAKLARLNERRNHLKQGYFMKQRQPVALARVQLLRISVFCGLLGSTPLLVMAEDGSAHHHGEAPITTAQHNTEAASTHLHHSHGAPAGGEPEPGEAASTETVLSLERLEQMALENNPTVAQATAQARAAAGRTLQAGLYPNPAIGYSGSEISSPASGGEHGGFVQQTIVTAGKLGLSRAISQQEQLQAEEQLQAQRLRVVNAVRLAYYDTAGAQQLVTWRERLAALAREAVDISHGLFNVGQADQPDLLQAEIEAQQAELDLDAARHELERAWSSLATVVGNPTLPRQTVSSKLDEELPELDWNQVLVTLLEESPDLKVAKTGVQRAEAALKRAQVEWIPDITFRGGVHYNFERFAPKDQRVGPEGFAEIRVPLPVFDRNQGNIEAAQAELERARREVQRVELSLRQRLSAASAEYLTARRTVEAYSQRILPSARQAYEMYLQRYQQMAAAYPQVLIAQRTLFQAQAVYAAALTSLRRADVKIRGLLLVDGLAAPATSEITTGASGREATAARPFGMRRTGGEGGE
jgi:cobalt-zinc-cadmium efflux system outer membrane protein